MRPSVHRACTGEVRASFTGISGAFPWVKTWRCGYCCSFFIACCDLLFWLCSTLT